MQDFVIVEFTATQEVEVVWHEWIKNKNTICFWPPFKTSSKIKRAILHHQKPDVSQWKAFDIRIIGSYATYQIARQKLHKAEHTSDINTDADDYGRGKRTTSHIHCSDNSSSEMEFSDTGISEIHLPVPPLPLPAVVHKTFNMNNGNKSTPSVERESEFQKIVLRDLQIIKALQRQQGEIIDTIFLHVKSKKGTQNTEESQETIYRAEFDFPLKTFEELESLEKDLQDDGTKLEHLTNVLRNVGGVNFENTVRRILKKVFNDEVASEFSWLGAKGKRPFASLHVTEAIFGAVRQNCAFQGKSDSEIELVVKNWLRHAKARSSKATNATKENAFH